MDEPTIEDMWDAAEVYLAAMKEMMGLCLPEEPESERSTDMEKMGLQEAALMAQEMPDRNVVRVECDKAYWDSHRGLLCWSTGDAPVQISPLTLFGWRRVQGKPATAPEPEWLDAEAAEAALKVGKRVECEAPAPGVYNFLRKGEPWIHCRGGEEYPLPLSDALRYRVIGEAPQVEPVPPDVPEGFEAWEVMPAPDTGMLVVKDPGAKVIRGEMLYWPLDQMGGIVRFTGLYGYEGPHRVEWHNLPRVWRNNVTGVLDTAPPGMQVLVHLKGSKKDWEAILPRYVLMQRRSDGQG